MRATVEMDVASASAGRPESVVAFLAGRLAGQADLTTWPYRGRLLQRARSVEPDNGTRPAAARTPPRAGGAGWLELPGLRSALQSCSA